MKVNILSMQRVENYGSFLQAYGMKKTLESLGHTVDFLDIIPGKTLPSDIIQSTRHEYSNNRKFDRYFFKRVLNKLRDKKFSRLYSNYILNYLSITDQKLYDPTGDAVVIGSDEVFNCLQSSPWGYSNQIFGNIDAKKVLTYAASCGFTTYDGLTDYLKKDIKVGLDKLSYISVRDKNTLEFIKSFGFNNVTESLDPVLISNFDEELSNNPIKKKDDKKYLIVYAYKNRIHKEEEVSAIKKFAKAKNLKIVALGGSQIWADEYWVINPFELLNAFKGASFIITDTFHGSIFSIKYNLNYVTLVRDSNKNKLNDLFERLDQKDRLLDSFSNLDYFYDNKPNFEHTNKIILSETEKSVHYLRNSLSEG